MNTNNQLEKKLVSKYEQLIREAKTGGEGTFTTNTRYRLLGVQGRSGRGRKEKDFWFHVRNQVRGALIDLQLFIEVGGDNVNQVVTEEKLKPMVETLLWHPIVDGKYPDINRAEIARLFVNSGLNYLENVASFLKSDTLLHKHGIEEAKNLSDFLVESFEKTCYGQVPYKNLVRIREKQEGQLQIEISKEKFEAFRKKHPEEVKELFEGERSVGRSEEQHETHTSEDSKGVEDN